MPTLTLSQTATPFPFALLGAASFANAQLGADVVVEWERDSQTKLDRQALGDDAALAKIGDLLKGKEVSPASSDTMRSVCDS